MIWLTWRQYRIEALIAVLALVLLGIFYINDGLFRYAIYQHLEWVTCGGTACNVSIASAFNRSTMGTSGTIASFLYSVLCLLIGVFVGAPMVAREREQSTQYLLWTQGITRRHWLAVKLSLVTIATLLMSMTIAVLMTWWSEPLSRASGPWGVYTVRGFFLPASAVFMLFLGVAVGTFVRRTVPAMALTFLLLVLLLVAHNSFYAHLILPVSRTETLTSIDMTGFMMVMEARGLFMDAGYIDSSGREWSTLNQYCGLSDIGSPGKFDSTAYVDKENKCIKEHHLRWRIIYQPVEHFWILQGVESAILLLLSVALVPLIFWRLEKRWD